MNSFATRDSNGFCNAIRMVLQRAIRMVLQHDSNGFATRFEWFCNAIQMVLQRGSNGFEQQDYKVQSSKLRIGSGEVPKRKEPGDTKHRKEVNIVTLS